MIFIIIFMIYWASGRHRKHLKLAILYFYTPTGNGLNFTSNVPLQTGSNAPIHSSSEVFAQCSLPASGIGFTISKSQFQNHTAVCTSSSKHSRAGSESQKQIRVSPKPLHQGSES